MANDRLSGAEAGMTRQCRPVPGSASCRRSPLVVRHHGTALLVVAGPRTVRAQVHGSGRKAAAAFTVAVLVLAAALTCLLIGPPAPAPADPGPCSRRTSLAMTDAGQTLLVRPEVGSWSTALIHLCAGAVRVAAWSATLTDRSGRTTPLPVQAVGDRLALAAAPTGDRPELLTVRIRLTSGVAAIFRTSITIRQAG